VKTTAPMAASADRPLRVLHLDSERPWRGGEQQVLLLMRRQRTRGDEPHLAAPAEGALAQRAMGEGFPLHRVPMRGTWDLGSVLAIAKLHRTLRPDVVHWHAARAHALGAMAALLSRGPALVLSRRVDFPVRRSVGSRLLYRLDIDAIAAISEAVRGALVQSGLDAAGIHIVPSGIDAAPLLGPFDRPAARARLGMGESEIVALNVAALAPHKSQTDLLRAAAITKERCPLLCVWIVGEGPLMSALHAEHASLRLGDTVRFLGFRSDVADLLRAADLFCLSSRLEGLGTSILEAMAAGLPVVATRAGGIPEIVAEGVTGLLVPPGNPDALADALVAMASDTVRRTGMGGAARERARGFSADRTAELTRALYLRAIETHRGRSRERERLAPG